jgi:hypothetical protein
MTTPLERAGMAYEQAAYRLLEELMREYPVGDHIRAWLQVNHREPVKATVIGHNPRGPGTLRIRLHTGHETTIHYRQATE